jgi:isoaspartyl peptidase/L-asparaginase-like protein (Ntn-hydrolase superfamily)
MDSPHVLLCGEGATSFARARGHPEVDVSTERTRRRHQKALERLRTGELRPPETRWSGWDLHGTIGVVARCPDGTFAAASSTGGTSIMLPGRVGDSAVFGAGMMVSETAAIVATGDGEEIIRRLCAARLHQRLTRGMHPQEAADLGVAEMPEPWVVGYLVVTADAHAIAATDGKMAAYALTS